MSLFYFIRRFHQEVTVLHGFIVDAAPIEGLHQRGIPLRPNPAGIAGGSCL